MTLIKGIDILIYCFFGFLSMYTCHMFFSITLGYEKSKKVPLLIAYVIYFIIMAVVNITVALSTLNFISCLIGLLVISTFYNSNLSSKIIYSIIVLTFLSFTETFLGISFSMVTGNKMDTILNNKNMLLFLYSLSSFLPFMFLKIYSISNKKANYEINSTLPKDVLIQLFDIPMISIILINIVFFNLIEKINTMAEQKIENNMLNSQIEYYNSLYENINNERNETLKLKHNVKNS